MINAHAAIDHSVWLQDYITHTIRRRLRTKRGSGGREKGDPPVKLSPFQKRVANILGMMAGGLDRAPVKWETAGWEHNGPGGMYVVWADNISTWDFAQLTLLVFLCHEARIRCEVTGLNIRYIRLAFQDRAEDNGRQQKHPTLDEAVAWFRSYLPKNHAIYKREKT